MNIAVIDKDSPGGICLIIGCIPSKMLLYPAEFVRNIDSTNTFGINASISGIDFRAIMEKMRKAISSDIEMLRRNLQETEDFNYPERTEFISSYSMDIHPSLSGKKGFPGNN
jgi:dihydrolipoamide dehydrogenase